MIRFFRKEILLSVFVFFMMMFFPPTLFVEEAIAAGAVECDVCEVIGGITQYDNWVNAGFVERQGIFLPRLPKGLMHVLSVANVIKFASIKD